jgi:single-strand DNA-binding protein
MQDGTAVTNFSCATNRKWTDGATGEPTEETTWFRVSVWGKQAETVNQYLKKGRQVLVTGRLKPDPQTGGPKLWSRQDGTMGASFEIVANTVRFLGGADEDGGNGSQVRPGTPAATEEDEIPF